MYPYLSCVSLAKFVPNTIGQAPDGGQEGGSQPTDSRVLNRRVFLAPALPIEQGKKHAADVKKLLPILDIGSHINAPVQAPPTVEATYERRLIAVACMRLLGRPQSSGVWQSNQWQQ